MKKTILMMLAFGFCLELIAQDNEHIVSIGQGDPSSVYACDIDGDGDPDVISASSENNTVTWHENNGAGVFNSSQSLTQNALGASSVYAVDLDGDTDFDVLSASADDDQVAWYENTDGLGNFGNQQSITANADGASCVYATDLDNDGDKDVLSASKNDDKIAWYENMDGLGTFGAQQVIATNMDGTLSVYASDLDGDADHDVLASSFNADKVVWYENTDGQGTFGAEQIIEANAQDVQTVHADDLDGDGDMDVLFSSWNGIGISWYENTNGQGAFVFRQNRGNIAGEVGLVKTADMDNDGDMDIVANGGGPPLKPGNNNAFTVGWYENFDGLGDFGYRKVIYDNALGLTSAYPADINGDGNMDVVSASTDQEKVAWHENIVISAINESMFRAFFVYPNPTTGILNIESKTPILKTEIHNLFGQRVFVEADKNQMDLSKLGSGVYFLKVIGKNGKSGTRKIVKE